MARGTGEIRESAWLPAHRHDPELAQRDHPDTATIGREGKPGEAAHRVRLARLGKVCLGEQATRTLECESRREGDFLRRPTRCREPPEPAVCRVEQLAAI